MLGIHELVFKVNSTGVHFFVCQMSFVATKNKKCEQDCWKNRQSSLIAYFDIFGAEFLSCESSLEFQVLRTHITHGRLLLVVYWCKYIELHSCF